MSSLKFQTRRGFRRSSEQSKVRIVVSFDDETFGQVDALARKRNVSFAAIVRELVEFGLIDIEEAA